MNPTSHPSAADTAQITEAQVVSFLHSKADELARATGINYAHISLAVNHDNNALIQWTTYVDGSTHAIADTVDAAIAQQVDVMAPRNRIAKLLAEAAKLTAEADAIAAKKDQPAPVADLHAPLNREIARRDSATPFA